MEPRWFKSFLVSEFGGKNHIDLQNIDQPSEQYDVVICNHVLEHVPDDVRAFGELLRIVKASGFLQVTVPLPRRVAKTHDWGFAREDLHCHFRTYGIDVLKRFEAAHLRWWVSTVLAADDATGTEDFVFFFTVDPSTHARFAARLARGARSARVREVARIAWGVLPAPLRVLSSARKFWLRS